MTVDVLAGAVEEGVPSSNKRLGRKEHHVQYLGTVQHRLGACLSYLPSQLVGIARPEETSKVVFRIGVTIGQF